MAAMETTIPRELVILPGETISDILSARNITQAELVAFTGVQPTYVSAVITGQKDISPEFAMALEDAFGVPKSFWINLQANYEAEIALTQS